MSAPAAHYEKAKRKLGFFRVRAARGRSADRPAARPWAVGGTWSALEQGLEGVQGRADGAAPGLLHLKGIHAGGAHELRVL